MRTLHLLRHGKSSFDDRELDDRERPLAPRGVRAAALVGVYLAQERLVPELVLCSSARRAAETWQRAAAELPRPPRLEREDALYMASARALLDRVRRVDDAVQSLLLVGHNPGFAELATRLAGDDAEAVARIGKFPTASLASFALARGGWGALGSGRVALVRFVRPADLV